MASVLDLLVDLTPLGCGLPESVAGAILTRRPGCDQVAPAATTPDFARARDLSSRWALMLRRPRGGRPRAARSWPARGPGPCALFLATTISVLQHPRCDIAPAEAEGKRHPEGNCAHQRRVGDRDDLGGDSQLIEDHEHSEPHHDYRSCRGHEL